jgi:hypothetical protein
MATRQASLNCERLASMQAVTFGTSGINSLHSRMASGVHACWASGLPCAAAPSSRQSNAPTSKASQQPIHAIRIGNFPRFLEVASPSSEASRSARSLGGIYDAAGHPRKFAAAATDGPMVAKIGSTPGRLLRYRHTPGDAKQVQIHRPQAKPLLLRARSLIISSGHCCMDVSAASAVALSNVT